MDSYRPSRRAFLGGSLAVLGGGAYLFGRSGGSDDGPTTVGSSNGDSSDGISPTFHSSEQTSELGIDLEGKPLMGSPDAPIDLYYWTDFQCPFCARFERETLPEIVRKQVEPGNVRVVFIWLPYFGEDSMTAAVAAACVWRRVRDDSPDTYWDWQAAVFEEQGEKNSGWASEENLLEITRSVSGVDADALETCLQNRRDELEAEIDADVEQASSYDVTGTPTFGIFDRESKTWGKLVGAQPYARFEEAIRRVDEAEGE